MAKTGKKVPDSASVGYIGEGAGYDVEPGYYIMEGKPEESEVQVLQGKHAMNPDHDEDDPESSPFILDPRGRPTFEGVPQPVGSVTVKHETNFTPGTRVYASPDGEGFLYDDPEGGEE